MSDPVKRILAGVADAMTELGIHDVKLRGVGQFGYGGELDRLLFHNTDTGVEYAIRVGDIDGVWEVGPE